MGCISEQVAQAEDARIAARLIHDAAELSRWKGITLLPSKGCKLRDMCFGDATVKVEYEYFPGESQTRDHPGADPEVIVVGVLINGALFDPEGLIDASVIGRWEQELLEHEIETANAEAEEAAEARYQWARELDGREAA